MPLSGASETLVRRWVDRAENRSEWERLRVALSIAEGFQLFALQVGDPITEHFLEMLLKSEAGDNGVELAEFDLSQPPEEGPIVSALLRALEAAPRPSWFFLRGCSMFREDQSALAELFLYLNQKRDVVSKTAGVPFLLSLSPEGWLLFRQTAPDFFSIHTSVYRFSGAEIRREERLREASEEAFLWQTFAEFVALRFLRSALPPNSLRKQVWPPPARDGLIGRDSERKTLRTWLAQPGARILVQGLGGVGKTSLLRAIMEEMPSGYPDGIFYFSLRNGGDVPRIMAEVVESLRPGLLAPLVRRSVLEAMFRDATAEARVLLVLDDAEDLGALERLAPSPPSAVLAAGRAGPAPDGWRGLSLDLLGTRESIELLQRISPSLPRETARSLAHEARGYPLLLQLLGGVARAAPQRLDRWTESSRTRVFSWDPMAGLGTIQAAAFELPPELKEAWRGAAVFQASFETERFQAVAGLASVELARERLEDLASRRLLDHSKEGLWSMHPLLRLAALRFELLGGEPTEALWRRYATYHLQILAVGSEEWKDFLPDVEEALRWLGASGRHPVPSEIRGYLGSLGAVQTQEYLRYLSGRGASVWLDAVARSAGEDENPGLAAEARRWSALACVRDGDADGARERFTGARELARESGNADSEAMILRDQAAFAFWTGRADETSDLAQETLRLSPKGRTRGDLILLAMLAGVSLGKGPPVELDALSSLAEGADFSPSPALPLLVTSTIRGRLIESSSLESVQKDLETAFEPTANPDGDVGVLARASTLRAELSLRQGDVAEARTAAEFAVLKAHAVYEWEAESEALRVLGQIHETAGDLAGAESSYRRLLELREQLYSVDHEGVAWAAQDLVRVLAAMGRHAEAEPLARRAAGIFQRGRPGTDHALATTLSQWGLLLVALGSTSEAETVLREALAASLNALGPAHLRSVHIMGQLAYVTLTAGRLDEAEDLLRSAVAIQDRSEATETRAGQHVLGQNLSLLAQVLAARGKTRDALAILQDRQLPIFNELGDPRHRAITLGQIGSVLASDKRYDEALPLLRKRLDLFDEMGDIRGRATALGDIATFFAAQKRYDEAIPALREQLHILEKLDDRQATEEARKILQTYEAEARE